jgi:outer membrane protein TolC
MQSTKECKLFAPVAALVVFLAAGPGPLASQDMEARIDAPPIGPGVYHLTLEQAKSLALAHAKALHLARLNVGEKEHATSAARKDFFPKILGNATYFHFNDELGSVLTLRRGRLGILPPGTRTINVAVLNQDTSLATALLAQPITKLIAVNGLVQIARADETIARAQLDQGTREVLSGVAQAYYGLVGARRIEGALRAQADILEQVGGAGADPKVRISLLEVRQGLIEVQGQAQELTDQLNSLLGFAPGVVLELDDPMPPPPPVSSADEAALLALSCNPEVIESEQGLAKAEAALKIARTDLLPDINVLGGYANQTGASYIQQDIGFMGVTASYTFWDWGKRRDLTRQRRAQIGLAYQTVQVTRERVDLAARKAYGVYEQSQKALALAREMVQASQEAESGLTEPDAIAAAKGATAKAELDLMKAEIAYRVAHAQLTAAIGSE